MRTRSIRGWPGRASVFLSSCACGTCRIYIEGEWREMVGAAKEEEPATRETHEDAAQSTRLSCQVKVTAELDGLIPRMREKQF